MASSQGHIPASEAILYEDPNNVNGWVEDNADDNGTAVESGDDNSNLSDIIENEELRRIATVLSRNSLAGQHPNLDQVMSFANGDPTLDPTNKAFDSQRWAQHIFGQIESQGIRSARTGIMFKDLTVSGTGAAVQLQETLGSTLTSPLRPGELLSARKNPPKKILNTFDGLLRSGELVIVLGRPGSGCTTLLKTMTGELTGLNLDKSSVVSYDGISQQQIIKEFKGDVVYNQEVDRHFPHLTVGQTLEFAAAARTPSNRLQGMSRKDFSSTMTQVTMAICGLSHTYNTKVGDDFVRGVSGGERKRVSIAEMMLTGSPFAAWDNRYVSIFSCRSSAYLVLCLLTI